MLEKVLFRIDDNVKFLIDKTVRLKERVNHLSEEVKGLKKEIESLRGEVKELRNYFDKKINMIEGLTDTLKKLIYPLI